MLPRWRTSAVWTNLAPNRLVLRMFRPPRWAWAAGEAVCTEWWLEKFQPILLYARITKYTGFDRALGDLLSIGQSGGKFAVGLDAGRTPLTFSERVAGVLQPASITPRTVH